MTLRALLTTIALGILALLPAAVRAESPATGVPAVATADDQPTTAPVDTAPPAALDQVTVGATSSGVWTYLTTESCYDLFLRSCTSSFPSPQCPPDAEGKPCSPINSYCWDTVSSSRVDYYRCR